MSTLPKKLPRQDLKIATFDEFRTWWFSNLYGQDFEAFWVEILKSPPTPTIPIRFRPFSRFDLKEGKLVSRIEKLRKEKGWTQEDLAEKSGGLRRHEEKKRNRLICSIYHCKVAVEEMEEGFCRLKLSYFSIL